MAPSIWQLLIVLVIVLVLFGGRGKISQLMGDFGKGIKSFRSGMSGNDEAEDPKKIDDDAGAATKTASTANTATDGETAKTGS